SETSFTGRPASRKNFAVPPVLISSTLNSFTSAVANSFNPVLSETEISARRTGTRSDIVFASEKEYSPRRHEDTKQFSIKRNSSCLRDFVVKNILILVRHRHRLKLQLDFDDLPDRAGFGDRFDSQHLTIGSRGVDEVSFGVAREGDQVAARAAELLLAGFFVHANDAVVGVLEIDVLSVFREEALGGGDDPARLAKKL